MDNTELTTQLTEQIKLYTEQIYTAISDVLKKSLSAEEYSEFLSEQSDVLLSEITEQLKTNITEIEDTDKIFVVFNEVYGKILNEIKEKVEGLQEITTKIEYKPITVSQNFFNKQTQLLKGFSDFIEQKTSKISELQNKIDSIDVNSENVSEIESEKSEESSETETPIEEIQKSKISENQEELSKDPGYVKKSRAINEATKKRLSFFSKIVELLSEKFKLYKANLLKMMSNKIADWFATSDNLIAKIARFGLSAFMWYNRIKSIATWFIKNTDLGKRVAEWVTKLKAGLLKRWTDFKTSFITKWKNGWDKIVNSRFGKWIVERKNALKEAINGTITKFKTKFTNWGRNISTSFKNWMKNNKFVQVLKSARDKVLKVVKTAYNIIAKPFKYLFGKLKDLVIFVRKGVNYALKLKGAISKGGGLFSNIGNFLLKKGLVGKVINGLKKFTGFLKNFGKMFKKLFGFVGFIFDAVDSFKRFQQGDWVGGMIHGSLALIGGLQFIPVLAPVLVPTYTALSLGIGALEMGYEFKKGKALNYTLMFKKVYKAAVEVMSPAIESVSEKAGEVVSKVKNVFIYQQFSDNVERLAIENVGNEVFIDVSEEFEDSAEKSEESEPITPPIELKQSETIVEIEPITLRFSENFSAIINNLNYRVKCLN
jgi:hypothetical protein